MSVLKSKRGESSAQFLETARELELYTLRQCVKFPKRYTFFITNEIVRLSQEVLNGVKSANSIYPTNPIEAQLRRNYFIEAYCSLQNLISQLSIAKELFGTIFEAKIWTNWLDLIESEAKMITAIKKSDKERFKFDKDT